MWSQQQDRKNAAVVVTTISPVNDVMRSLQQGSAEADMNFIIIGDRKSPSDFELLGSSYFSLADQYDLPFACARKLPTGHYSRKNLGYLLAARAGSEYILETDDDNIPREDFFAPFPRRIVAETVESAGWVNMYGYFSDRVVWPRGFPLDQCRELPPDLSPATEVDAIIQQGLADDNPDVDAIYRMTFELPMSFESRPPVALGYGSWCPFNSQNTTFYAEAYPLLYLPSFCSFRMTDIWRSFVAIRVCQRRGWNILFREATVRQERNEHDLMVDFRDEVDGYLNNSRIVRCLSDTVLDERASPSEQVFRCYQSLVEIGVIPAEELNLLGTWLEDLENLQPRV